jgi:hypothetical protein
MRNRSEERCVDCGAEPPKTQTHYTLIERYGWRLALGEGPDGHKRMDLRCPGCWAEYRAQHAPSGKHLRSTSADASAPLSKRRRHGS